jgi:hypothetical protein
VPYLNAILTNITVVISRARANRSTVTLGTHVPECGAIARAGLEIGGEKRKTVTPANAARAFITPRWIRSDTFVRLLGRR